MINPFSETDEYKIEIFAPNFVESDNRITEQINNIHKTIRYSLIKNGLPLQN